MPDSHTFKENTDFDDIMRVYSFDRKLRILLLDIIERIEVAIKAAISNHMSLALGNPHWYLEETSFKNSAYSEELKMKVKDSIAENSEMFLSHYLSKYTEPDMPPSWMMMELVTLGTVSRIYENIAPSNKVREDIARSFKTLTSTLESWLKAMRYLRNLCAHHQRVWNKRLIIQPRLPNRKEYRVLINMDEKVTHKKLYGILSCMLYLLGSINPNSDFRVKLLTLMKDYSIDPAALGFHVKWKEEEIWGI